MIRALLFVLTLGCGTCSAQQQQAHFDDVYVYDKFVDSYVKGGAFSGTVLVARDGKPIFEGAYGLASISFDVPNTVHTKFKIHSTTKSFTAAAIMQLVQQGKLTIDAPITKYLPGAPKSWEAARIKHLLSHTSGIPDFTTTWLDEWEESELRTLGKVLPRIKDVPLAGKPGESFSYSNSGYELLGCILEREYQQAYPDIIRDHIFAVLKMNDTGIELPAPVDHSEYIGPAPVKHLAIGYNGAEGHPEISNSLMFKLMAAGGIYSTAGDLLKFDQALYTDTLLSRQYREQMFSAVYTNEKTGRGYGFGWIVGKRGNTRYVRHDGGNNGFISALDRYIDDRVTVIILSNFGFFDKELESFREGLAAIALGK